MPVRPARVETGGDPSPGRGAAGPARPGRPEPGGERAEVRTLANTVASMSTSEVFTSYQAEHRLVSSSLNNRLGALDRRLKGLSASDFRLTDEELVSSLASYWDVEPPELGPEEVLGPEKSVRVATPIVQVELIMRVVAGDPAILQYWPDGTRAELAMPEADAPSGFDPLPPTWRIEGDELRFRAQ